MRSAFWPNALRLPLAAESLEKNVSLGGGGRENSKKLSFHQRCWEKRGGENGVH